MKEYLVRAGLEYTWDWEQESQREKLRRPWKLPFNIGPFQLNQSPNIKFYLADLGWDISERSDHECSDWRYPVSLLYIEKTIKVPDNGRPQAQADEELESFESLLRLFQPGSISVQRNYYMPRVEEQGLRDTIFFGGPPIKVATATLYERQPYPFDDDVLSKFTVFFYKYWSVLQNNPSSYLTIALSRFNSSYEKRSLADRLIDIVIALEALWGDSSFSKANIIAKRCSTWLNQPGKERQDASEFIKKMYKTRNNVVHGEEDRDLSEKHDSETHHLNQLEDVVRASLVKFLDYVASHGKMPHGKEIDSLIITGKV